VGSWLRFVLESYLSVDQKLGNRVVDGREIFF
jgi:hypothetical protein